MKPKIHPKYYEIKVKCACGHEIIIGAAAAEIHIEICSNCHPFYTGKQKLVDTAGRIDKYNRKFQKGIDLKKKRGASKVKHQEAITSESPPKVSREVPTL